VTAALDLSTARQRAESLMSSICTIRSRATGSTTDPDTGEVTDTPGGVVYSGICRVRPAGPEAQHTDAGGAEMFQFDYLVSVPFAVTGVAEGHRLQVTASADPAAGRGGTGGAESGPR
jgi:hypothetical protein